MFRANRMYTVFQISTSGCPNPLSKSGTTWQTVVSLIKLFLHLQLLGKVDSDDSRQLSAEFHPQHCSY